MVSKLQATVAYQIQIAVIKMPVYAKKKVCPITELQSETPIIFESVPLSL